MSYAIYKEWKKEILSGEGTDESPYVYGDTIMIDIVAVDAWMKSNAGEYYAGCQSMSSRIEFWFTEEPSQEHKDAVDSYWNSLDENSDEAGSYVARSVIDDAISAARASLLAKIDADESYDNYTKAEKKLAAGIMPSKTDLGL